jgi:hypothetical protein
MAAVSFSQLKVGSKYVFPAPSDVERFTMGAVDSDGAPPQVWINQRNKLLTYVGQSMEVDGKESGYFPSVHIYIKAGDEAVIAYEHFFPPGQLFKPFVKGVDIAPPLVALAPAAQPAPQPSAHPWDEFDSKNDDDHDDEDEVKIKSPLSDADISAQEKFGRSLTVDETQNLGEYKNHAHRFVTPLMLGHKDAQAAEEAYAKEAKKGPGFIEEFMSTFRSTLSKAPKLTKEINVFRGVDSKEGLNMPGKQALSTSYDKYVATRFAEERRCCMLKINVKPGVGVIALDMILGESEEEGEKEILICPPYTAKIEDVGDPESGVKKVTITPATPGGGRRRTRKPKRRSRKTRRRHK